MWRILVLTLVALAAGAAAQENKKLKLTLEKVDLETDPSYLTATAAIRMENGKSVVDFTGNILQDIDSGIFVDIAMLTESDPGKFKPLLKTDDFDFCQYEQNNTSESAPLTPLLNMFLNDINNFGNVPLKCPVKKGAIQVKGFHIDEEKLPNFTPEARYLIESKIYVNKDGNNRHVIYSSKWIVLITKE